MDESCYTYGWVMSHIWMSHVTQNTYDGSFHTHNGIVDMTLKSTCDMSHSYVWHDSSICVTWLIHMRDITLKKKLPRRQLNKRHVSRFYPCGTHRTSSSPFVPFFVWQRFVFGQHAEPWRGGGLGSRPKKMYGERLGDGVEYHLMRPTPRR